MGSRELWVMGEEFTFLHVLNEFKSFMSIRTMSFSKEKKKKRKGHRLILYKSFVNTETSGSIVNRS